MGKPKKQHKKFNYSADRKKLWKKSKQMPSVRCAQLKAAWDEHKSIHENMRMMGLSSNANKSIPLPKSRVGKGENSKMPIVDDNLPAPNKLQVAKELEAEASVPQESTVRLSKPEVSYCTYMMDKYGEDYKAMARDRKNYYQDTPKQIRRKIQTFMKMKEEFREYLASRTGEPPGSLMEETT